MARSAAALGPYIPLIDAEWTPGRDETIGTQSQRCGSLHSILPSAKKVTLTIVEVYAQALSVVGRQRLDQKERQTIGGRPRISRVQRPRYTTKSEEVNKCGKRIVRWPENVLLPSPLTVQCRAANSQTTRSAPGDSPSEEMVWQ